MRLTKYTHACVRLEKDGKVLLVDPGTWSEDAAFEGVDAVLVTHEHFDHLDAERLAKLDAPIWTNAGVAAALDKEQLTERVTVVGAGDRFQAAGFTIDAFGNDHAIILPELGVPCQNTAFLIDDAVYHPGDSWTRPGRAVHTNLVPLGAPWYSLPEAIEYVRDVDAEQVTGIHDNLLSDVGKKLLGETWIGPRGGRPYVPLAPGESVEIS